MFDSYQITFLAFTYLVGAIPTGYWFAKFFFNIDVTQVGSGNIGATNIARVLGKRYFILIFFIDAGKAFLALYLANRFVSQTDMFIFSCAVLLLLGNAYSIFLTFKGGKGVATSLGILCFLLPVTWVCVFIALWLGVLLIFKEVFIASLSAIVCITVGYGIWFGITDLFYFLVVICLWLIARHHRNISLFLTTKK